MVAVYDDSNNWLQNFVWNDEVDGIQALEQADVLDYDGDGNTSEVTRSLYHRNPLGSVLEITDLNQIQAVSYRYDPYGKVTITRGGSPQASDPLGQHWTFTGRFLDEENDLLYYRARYYDSGTGRFLARDPLGYDEGPSLFEYVRSSPINRTDPGGMQELEPGERRQRNEILDKIEEETEEQLEANYGWQTWLQRLRELLLFLQRPVAAGGGGTGLAPPVLGPSQIPLALAGLAQLGIEILKLQNRSLLVLLKSLRRVRAAWNGWRPPMVWEMPLRERRRRGWWR